MPQIQVLGRERMEQRESQANRALEQQKVLADVMQKSQMLRFYYDELKSKERMAQGDVEKAKIQQRVENAKLAASVMENAYKIVEKHGGAAGEQYLVDVQKSYPELFPGVFQDGFGDRFSKLRPSGSERLAGSAADLVEQEMDLEQPGAQPTNQGRVGALDGQASASPKPQGERRIELTGISGNSPSFAFPAAQARMERSNVMARKTAERDVEMEPIRNSVNYYIDTFDKAVEEMGGLQSTQVSALGKGTANSVWANIGNKPNTLALQQMSKSVALQLGSYLNKGRPTEQDAAAAAQMLVKLTLTEGANEVLRRYLQIVVSGKDMYTGRDARGETHTISPAADKIYDMLHTGRVPKEDFIIVEIKR